MSAINTKAFVLIAVAAIGFVMAGAAILLIYDSFTLPAERVKIIEEAYDVAVLKILAPMFTTLITAALAYIFGEELVSSWAHRIRGDHQRGSPGIEHSHGRTD
jgi:hypothetical protein